jgi:hypothetical protein
MLININWCALAVAITAVLAMVYAHHVQTSILRDYLSRVTDIVADSVQRQEALKSILETLIREGYRK